MKKVYKTAEEIIKDFLPSPEETPKSVDEIAGDIVAAAIRAGLKRSKKVLDPINNPI